MEKNNLVSIENIEQGILFIRGHKVILADTLAKLYQVEVRILNQAVKRNFNRFPVDFLFQLTKDEAANLKSQFVISSLGHGGARRGLPYAFTEHGIAMLSSVLNSKRAVMVNIEIVRTFIRLRQMLQTNVELSKRLDELEKKYDGQFSIVFKAIRGLMSPEEKSARKIGFGR